MAKKNTIKIPAKQLVWLEEELNRFSYESLPVGSCLAQLYYIELFEGKGHFSFSSFIKEKLHEALLYSGILKDHRYAGNYEGIPYGSYLMTLISEKRHLSEMILPVAGTFNEEEVVICARNEKTLSLSGAGSKKSLTFSNLPAIDNREWKKKAEHLKPEWKKVIREFQDRTKSSDYVASRIHYTILLQTRRYESCKILVSAIKPKAVLTEYDREILTSCLLSAAKHFQIPTYTMVHGVMNVTFAYTPLIADKVLVWGDRNAEQFAEAGVNPDQIRVTGAPQLSKKTLPDRTVICKTVLEISPSAKIALLATNPAIPEDRHALVSVFAEALSGLADLCGIVRIHPSEDLSLYNDQRILYPHIRFCSNKELSLEEALSAADVICTFNSAFSIDALINDKPLVIINIPSDNRGNVDELTLKGRVPLAENKQQLRDYIEMFTGNQGASGSLLTRQTAYKNSLLSATGHEAAQNIHKVLKS